MRKMEYEKIKEYILGWYDDDLEKLKEDFEICVERANRGEAFPSRHRGAAQMVDDGYLGHYYEQAYDALKEIYGENFDSSRYIDQNNRWRVAGGEIKVWSVYRGKIIMALLKMFDLR